jgi:DNA mismatch repair protein MSH3
MLRIADAFQSVDDPKEVGFQSEIINKAIAALPGIRENVSKFLGVFNHQSAGKDDKYNFFKENDDENPEYEAIMEHKLGISAVEADLIEHKQEICQTLKKKVGYMTVSGIEYLIEVANDKNSLNKIPASWVKISGFEYLSSHSLNIKPLTPSLARRRLPASTHLKS